MNNELNKSSFNLSLNRNQISSIFGLYLFSFGTTLLGFALYLFLESLGSVDKNYINWSGQGLFWAFITFFLALVILFLPIEFLHQYSIVNRSFNELLTNVVTVIVLSLFFLLVSQFVLNNENIFLYEYQMISRSVSFSGFITIPILFFAIHNLGRKFATLNKYSYSILLLFWLLSNQIFL
tara:strand:- start:400 stop:939 length:540 start_codon:yes stop_codon:yes gene_type:complete